MNRMHLCGPPRFALAVATVAGGKDIGLDKHDANAGTASTENEGLAEGVKKL
jgi:hypothetical protein